jgi:hypothetical protein
MTFPLASDGMVVQAVFGLNGPATAALVQSAQPIPRPVQVRTLLDSGTDITAIAPRLVQQLGLESLLPASSQTAGGLIQVNLYRVSLTVSGPAGRSGTVLTVTDLLVSELTTPLPNLEALIGLDVLRESLLVLDGPGQQFILGY